MFRRSGALPVYSRLASIDNVNYAPTTFWSRPPSSSEGGEPAYRRSIVAEATELDALGPERYDVVFSSHVLEHLANPIRGLRAWRARLRPSGRLLLVVPDRTRTFDHLRPATEVDHMLEDARRGVLETDPTHLEEIVRLHDVRWDTSVRGREELQRRLQENSRYRIAHHHVFNSENLAGLLRADGWTVEYLTRLLPFHIVALARPGRDSEDGAPVQNTPGR